MSLAQFIYTEVLKPKPLRALTNAILLRILPRSARVGAATIELDPTDPVVSGAITLRAYEPSELFFFQKYCRGDLTLVDVGANVGLYTSLAMHGLTSGGRVLAFEPRPQSFSYLEKNIASNRRTACPRVDAFNLAASTTSGTFTLYQNPDNHGDNRLYHSQDFQWQTTEVQARPLDDVLAEQGVTEINFLKIDVQGYEQQVFGGLKKTLRRSTNTILMTEFWPKGLTEAGGGPRAYLEELSDLGFQLFELKERPLGKLVPLGDWDGLIRELKGRKYANIVGTKGKAISF
jgi:FkbM family methyltransferase